MSAKRRQWRQGMVDWLTNDDEDLDNSSEEEEQVEIIDEEMFISSGIIFLKPRK